MGLVSLYWLYLAKVSFQKMPAEQWGKQLTIFSIVSIMVFCLLISVDFSAPDVPVSHHASLLGDLLNGMI